MGLQKSIVSTRTGATLTYHEVMQVTVNPTNASIMVASYPDQAAKTSGKQFSDVVPVQVPYDGSVLPKGVLAWAQDQVAATTQFSGATAV